MPDLIEVINSVKYKILVHCIPKDCNKSYRCLPGIPIKSYTQ